MKRSSALLSLALAVVSCTLQETEPLSGGQFVVQDKHIDDSPVPGLLHVKFSEVASDADEAAGLLRPYVEIDHINQRFPDDPRFTKRHHDAGLDRWYTIHFSDDIPVTKAGDNLSGLPFIEKVQEIRPAETRSVSFNDPMFDRQWHYNNTGQYSRFVKGADINLDEAWEYTRGNKELIVAVIDAGIRYTHEDLAPNMWTNESELNGQPGVDDDGNGYVDDIHGYNFCYVNDWKPYGTLVPEDHGTHVSGTISAVNGNGKGGCGIAGGDYPGGGVRIMSCQIIQAIDDKRNYPSDTDAAFIYAVDNGAVISNNSWGGSVSRDILSYFNENAGMDEQGNQRGLMAGGVSFFSAGNDNSQRGVPAMYDEAFAVAAVAPDMRKASYSNYGSWVDISAPGGDQSRGNYNYWGVYSCVGGTDSSYGWYQGTSMACPHVTGVAALAISALGGPGFTRQMLLDLLQNSADESLYAYNENYKGKLGAGMVDAGALIASVYPGVVSDFIISSKKNSLIVKWSVPREPFNSEITAFKLKVNDSTVVYSTGSAFRKDQTLVYSINDLEYDKTYTVSIVSVAANGYESKPSSTRNVTTEKNSLPVITLVDGISVTMNRNQSASLTFAYSDEEGDPLSIGLKSSGDGLSLTEAGVGRARVDIDAAKVFKSLGAGTFTATLTVSDAYGMASRDFTYTVLDHISPEIKSQIPDLTIRGIGVSQILRISDYFDCDASPSVDISTESPIVSYSYAGDEVEITSLKPGQTLATLTITDKYGDSRSLDFNILVRDSGHPADIYPTRVTDSFYVRTDSDSDEEILVRVLSATGQSIVNAYYKAGINHPARVKLPGSCAPGIYTVRVTFAGGTLVSQSIVKI